MKPSIFFLDLPSYQKKKVEVQHADRHSVTKVPLKSDINSTGLDSGSIKEFPF